MATGESAVAIARQAGMSREEGYFPRGSILRQVHRERAVGLLYGQRALGIGTSPRSTSSGTRRLPGRSTNPFRRLSHTGKAFETIFFGTRAEADHVLAYVERMHDKVEGELPEAARPYAAGTPCSAFAPSSCSPDGRRDRR